MNPPRNLEDAAERDTALGDLEALLFAASQPLALSHVARRVYLEETQAAELLQELQQALLRPSRGLQLREASGKWRLETKPDREDIVASLRAARRERPLTGQALETLAVVALRQPVTTDEVTTIRGAESYGTLETLRRHRLIVRSTGQEAARQAALWRTTRVFLDRFGLASPDELAQEGRLDRLLGMAQFTSV